MAITSVLSVSSVYAAEYEALRADNNKFIYCSGTKAKAGDQKDGWIRRARKLQNKNGKYLDCSEKLRDGDNCSCNNTGENFHGGPDDKGGVLKDSIGDGKSGKIFPNSGKEYCLSVNGSTLEVRASAKGNWGNCDTFKLTDKVDSNDGSTDDGSNGGGSDVGNNDDSDDGGDSDKSVKIAFIGDTGAGSNFQDVLDLIKSEGAELTVVAGDTSYDSSKDDDWDRMVRNTLGNDPALITAGNHDYGDSNFSNVVSYGKSRLNKADGVECSGTYGEKMTCSYKNVYFVLSSIGASGSQSGHESFISNSLNQAPKGAWRVCAWHKNQQEMQVGGKASSVGWKAYETCREKGAIIATGHEHSYSRTHLLSDMSSQNVASKSSTFTVEEGKTFAFVNGLGGVGIRDQERGGDHWAKIYTSSQGARYGAMFGNFYDNRAEFYFKNVRGEVIDEFTVLKGYDNDGGSNSGGNDTTRPVISLVGSNTMNVLQGSSFKDPGVSANDDVDGNLTGSISISGSVNTSKVGSYTLSYNVNDAAGNAARTVTRTVNVTLSPDTTAPVISLKGNSPMSITLGDSFNDPGATASDNRDGDVTSAVSRSGSVNTDKIGSYTLSYNVSDSAGNSASTVRRTVNVVSDGGSNGGGSGGTKILKQAENVSSSNGVKTSTFDPGYTGSGYIDFGGDDSWIEWSDITVLAEGDYRLTFRYTNGKLPDRTTLVYVNGNEQGNVSFGSTGGWSTWATDSIIVSLKQGINRVRLVANSGVGGPNLDSMSVAVIDNGGGVELTPRGLYTYSFGGLESMSVQDTVGLLTDYGYTGIAVKARGSDFLNRLDQYQNFSAQLGDDFNVISAFLAHKFGDYGFDDSGHRKAIDRLSGKGGQLWIWFRDDQNNVTTNQLESFIRQILDYAVSKNVKVVLYPHVSNMMDTVTDTYAMANKINHPNLGIAFNLTHELNAGQGNLISQNFTNVKDRVMAVTISGSKNGEHVQSLDNSSYDLSAYIRQIKASGFDGPVGFLNHRLTNPEEYLKNSIDTWNNLSLEVGLYEHEEIIPEHSNITLSVDDGFVEEDETVTINYTGSENSLDWIAIYKIGDNIFPSCEQSLGYVASKRVSNSRGSLNFNNLDIGSYHAQPYSNDGYCHAGNAIAFTVIENQNTDPVTFESHIDAGVVTSTGNSGLSTGNSGYTGAGYLDFGGWGTWVEWDNVSVPVTGSYRMDFRYANGGSRDRRTSVTINGENQGNVNFSPTADWTNWSNDSIVVTLNKGSNIVRLEANSSEGTGGPNLDSMHISLISSDNVGPIEDPVEDPDPQKNAIALPIEVLGAQGTKKTVSFELNDPSSITHLYLRCNSCGFDDNALDGNESLVKATVRVNDGSAIKLKHYIGGGSTVGNTNIDIIGPEKNWGGIGGGFRTVRMKVPVSGLKVGINTLTFEHKTLRAPSIGYRIIELNLLENGSMSRMVLSEADFVNDDPRDWESPRKSSSDIALGRELWFKENALNDPGLDKIDGSGNGDMTASCSGCHATDGRDLKYFNFSNLSIIERAKFHGMSQSEGELIASYIRSINIPVVDQARPWNPAYQPGPGLDDQPAYEWAAGAGIDAVLDDDADMKTYLFPSGTSLSDVRNVVDRYDTLNFRELPIAIPMPDWNQWLAPIHPDDAFRTGRSAITSDHKGDNVGEPYWEKLYDDARKNPSAQNLGNLTENINKWQAKGADCFANGKSKAWRTRAFNGDVLEALKIPVPNLSDCDDRKKRSTIEGVETVKKGLAGWGSVKMWDIIHRNDLETRSQSQGISVCSGGNCVDASEKRGWVVTFRTLFDRAAHFIGHDSKRFVNQDLLVATWENTSWYHLNLVLNPGYRSKQDMPSHFAYTIPWIERAQNESNLSQSYRYWATTIKMRQLQTNGNYGEEEGLDMRTAQPYVYFSDGGGDTDLRRGVGKDLWAKLATALLEDFVDDAEHATTKDWEQANQNSTVQDRGDDIKGCGSSSDPFPKNSNQGDNTYCVIPKYRNIGVSESVLFDLIEWSKDTWPNGSWNSLKN
jgi:sugar phosphate isomerase/epimerase